jgi:site-specific recombinase XerD
VIDGGLNIKDRVNPLSSSRKPKLLEQVCQTIRTRHDSDNTQEAYVGWIKRFIFFHNKRHPTEMAEAEIALFLSRLATESNVSSSTQNQALNALLFLYKEVLDKKDWSNPGNRSGQEIPKTACCANERGGPFKSCSGIPT